VKLLSPVLSLPTPNKAANQSGVEAASSGSRPEYLEQRTIQKLLLVGSGTSTILKQVRTSIDVYYADVNEQMSLPAALSSPSSYQCSHWNI
jgi:hypothetical protein